MNCLLSWPNTQQLLYYFKPHYIQLKSKKQLQIITKNQCTNPRVWLLTFLYIRLLNIFTMSRDHTFPFPVLVMSSQKKVVFFLFLKKQVKKENCDSIKMESKLQKKKKNGNLMENNHIFHQVCSFLKFQPCCWFNSPISMLAWSKVVKISQKLPCVWPA